MVQLIRRLIFKLRFTAAVNKAKRLHDITHRKYMVLIVKGKPQVLSKQNIRKLVQDGIFRKGTTVQDIEKKALYVTL